MSTTRSKAKSDAEEQASADAPPEEPAAAPQPQGYVAKTIPTPLPEPDPAPQRPVLPAGSVTLVYRGTAHSVDSGGHRFRPGEPVVVPSEVAEDLLTLPFEQFELLEEPKE